MTYYDAVVIVSVGGLAHGIFNGFVEGTRIPKQHSPSSHADQLGQHVLPRLIWTQGNSPLLVHFATNSNVPLLPLGQSQSRFGCTERDQGGVRYSKQPVENPVCRSEFTTLRKIYPELYLSLVSNFQILPSKLLWHQCQDPSRRSPQCSCTTRPNLSWYPHFAAVSCI